MTIRSQHWTDAPRPGIGQRCWSMRNWMNFETPHHKFREAAPSIIASPGKPDDWDGSFPFRRESQAGALQTFFDGTDDPDNRAAVHARLSARPGVGFTLKALDAEKGAASSFNASRQKWDGIFPECVLSFDAYAHKIVKRIILKRPGHPLIFRFALRLAAGLSIEFAGNGARILDNKGVEVFRLLPPWGRDSSVARLTLDGAKAIRVSLRNAGSRIVLGTTEFTIELRVNAEDMDDAVYPVEIDPTAIISGTTDIEDNTLIQNAPTLNVGDGIFMFASGGGSTKRNGLVRVVASALPVGSYSAFRWFVTRAGSVIATWTANRIVDANVWVEGSGLATPEAGASDWNYAADNTLAWASGVGGGCNSSGVDHDVASTSKVIDGAVTWVLPTEWAEDWRDATRVDNGFVLKTINFSTNIFIYSTEGATPHYFEIDHTLAGGIAQRFFFMGGM